MFKVAAVIQGSYVDLPIGAFKKPMVPELTAFKRMQTVDAGTVSCVKSHLIPGKKRNLEEAMHGEVYLTLSCYKDREKPTILPQPTIDDDGNVHMSEDEGSNGEEGEE